MAKQVNGAVLYEGPSLLDGRPIVVVATGLAGNSKNEKTGAMVQTWILRQDISPLEAINSGADASICGTCPHRGTIEAGKNKGRSCYVKVFQAPLAVWRAYKRGAYPHMNAGHAGQGRIVRLGSYGDPAAVPLSIWQQFTAGAVRWTGYSHAWRQFPELAPYVMASADSPADRAAAKLLGFRTFRVREAAQALEAGEITCPASKEAGYRTNCAACGLCKGATAKAKDIAIIAHGASAKAFRSPIAA